jgi:hypothetical protein
MPSSHDALSTGLDDLLGSHQMRSTNFCRYRTGREGIVNTQHDYRGWTIELLPQIEGDMWWCRYLINKTGDSTMRGTAIDLYSCCEDAETAALEKAQALIDAYCNNTMLAQSPTAISEQALT